MDEASYKSNVVSKEFVAILHEKYKHELRNPEGKFITELTSFINGTFKSTGLNGDSCIYIFDNNQKDDIMVFVRLV